MTETAKQKILKRLALAPAPLAIHEFNIPSVSQNTIGTRLPELAAVGLVVGQFLPGKAYKVWALPKDGQQVLPLGGCHAQ